MLEKLLKHLYKLYFIYILYGKPLLYIIQETFKLRMKILYSIIY